MRSSRTLIGIAVALLAAAIGAVGPASTAAGSPAASCASWQLMPTLASAPGTVAQPTGFGATWHSLGAITALSARDVMFTGNTSPVNAMDPWILRWDGHALTPGPQIPTPAVSHT